MICPVKVNSGVITDKLWWHFCNCAPLPVCPGIGVSEWAVWWETGGALKESFLFNCVPPFPAALLINLSFHSEGVLLLCVGALSLCVCCMCTCVRMSIAGVRWRCVRIVASQCVFCLHRRRFRLCCVLSAQEGWCECTVSLSPLFFIRPSSLFLRLYINQRDERDSMWQSNLHCASPVFIHQASTHKHTNTISWEFTTILWVRTILYTLLGKGLQCVFFEQLYNFCMICIVWFSHK